MHVCVYVSEQVCVRVYVALNLIVSVMKNVWACQ